MPDTDRGDAQDPLWQQQFKPRFLITIDTEGDNLWGTLVGAPTTKNSIFLWRFQKLCEEFGLRATYLTDYEMARCKDFQELGRNVIRCNAGEIGMHLHAWDTPPIVSLTGKDELCRPFLIEYPDQVIKEKVRFMTELLEDTFGIRPVSHRAGRWAFDERYARTLVEQGYRVDCSVTPGVSWVSGGSRPAGVRGSDYRLFRSDPYWVNLTDINVDGEPRLLEVPVTIFRGRNWSRVRPQIIRRALRRYSPEHLWLRPNRWNSKYLLEAAERVIEEGRPHAELMLHSSELMPGGSPTFKSKADVERLYRDLRLLFSRVAGRFEAATLSEFHDLWMGKCA
jgi:hypothetical protein